MIGAGISGISGLASLFRGRDIEFEANEPEPETQELDARLLPLLGAGISGISGLASLFRGRDLELEAREPEAETQELEARIIPLIGAGIAGLSGLSSLFRGRDLELEAREPEPETQELDARVLPLLIPGIAAGLTAVAAGAPLVPLLNRPKREPEPETQELEARILPLILPGLAAAAAVAPLIPGFPKPKRELSEELFSRESEPEAWAEWAQSVGDHQELEARVLPALLPGITAGLAGLSSITPLIPNFVNRPKREPSPEPQGFPLSRLRPPKFVTMLPGSDRFAS